jgi:Polyketide cyclase / dehydrase and lipid transport
MSRVVTNAIEVAADADTVFDYMTDLRNEPRWNPHMRDAEKSMDGVVGRGTRFRVVFGRGVGEALVEHITFDRPRSWSSLSRSRLLDVESANHVEPIPGGCRLVIGTQLFPHGALRLATPLLRRWTHATWARDLQTVKAQVERVSQENS